MGRMRPAWQLPGNMRSYALAFMNGHVQVGRQKVAFLSPATTPKAALGDSVRKHHNEKEPEYCEHCKCVHRGSSHWVNEVPEGKITIGDVVKVTTNLEDKYWENQWLIGELEWLRKNAEDARSEGFGG